MPDVDTLAGTSAIRPFSAVRSTVQLFSAARRHWVRLRQSCLRIAKRAAMMAGRYALPSSSTVTAGTCACCAPGLAASSVTSAARSAARLILRPCLSGRSRAPTRSAPQQQRQRGWKLYSFHAPEVECIGKGKASAPYEFGVKASIVTTNARAPPASSCYMPSRCRETPTMATRSALSLKPPKAMAPTVAATRRSHGFTLAPAARALI